MKIRLCCRMACRAERRIGLLEWNMYVETGKLNAVVFNSILVV